MTRLNESGRARYGTDAGTETVDNRTGSPSTHRPLRSPYIEFGGDRTRIGLFRWLGGSRVDGLAAPVYAQVLAGRNTVARGERGGMFLGFVVLGGLSYAAGAYIVLDPDILTDAIAELNPSTNDGRIFIAVATVAVVALVGLAVLLIGRRKTPKA